MRILQTVDDGYGRIDGVAGGALGEARFATRFCAAFGQLLLDPATPFDAAAYEQLVHHHRWIELLFSVSGFGSTDHLVALLSTGDRSGRRVPKTNLARFLLLYSAAAGMALDLDEAFAADGAVTVAAALGYLASRFCFTEEAQAFRERLLDWLPARLEAVSLGTLALAGAASPYMHCSYAASPGKHRIKAPLIAQMRRACLEAGCPECDPAAPPPAAERPTIAVSAENLSEGHSIWRTHSRGVAALRGAFRVVGVLHAQHRSDAVDALFDEVIPIAGEGGFLGVVKATAGEILARRPAAMLHLGVGLSSHVIALASLRLAPVQAASFGHTATTMSPAIDAMLLPGDFVGDPTLFSERLVRLPAGAFPYRLREDVDFAAIRARAAGARTPGRPVRIAVPASAMKLTPPVFDALARAAAAAKSPIQFRMFPLGVSGLGQAELARRLAARLPMAVVGEELPYEAYLAALAACDLFVCPFPYGNMNSIVDAVMMGLPGVCLDGPEAHSHADVAYFRRLGLPDALVASDLDAYVAQVVRLADDADWRATCRAAAARVDAGHPFFGGDGAPLAEAIKDLIAGAGND